MRLVNLDQANISVQQISNPARRGVTTGQVRRAGTRIYVEIEIGPNHRVFVESDDLEAIQTGMASPGDLITSLRFGSHGDLARILTYHKISSDLSNVFYAMQASRTNFYAYQFKPVYKFIESLNGRLLITDEVGLGKTVEAGLIWMEMRARTDAKRLLIVCPSMLQEKWKKELRERFNVKAQIYDSTAFKQLIEDFLRDGSNFQCAAICSLQSIRQDGVQDALDDLEEKQHRFDMVVIDEAHHLRNIGTKSHQVGRRLSDLTEAMVMLTATPIHLRNEDLFRLLSILDADEFNQQDLFECRLKQNAPVITAQNAIRSSPVNVNIASDAIGSLQDSSWFKENPLVPLTAKKLSELNVNDPNALVEIGRLIENLNLFGSIISRTRKREVQEWRVIRKPVVYSVEFDKKEAEFYHAVTDAVREAVSQWNGGAVASFALMMPQRQMASSIPAMIEHYVGIRFSNAPPEDDWLTEFGFLGDEESIDSAKNSHLSNIIKSLVSKWRPQNPDSKFNALSRAIQDSLAQNRQTKIIVFSFFKKTLEYLQRRLSSKGIKTSVIHGDIPMDDRSSLLEEFKQSNEINVLLSSEVGSEGIDLQFCNVLVNYDLPWNPMKVEQRIGRLDRLGQRSDSITIINFAVKGTIEERILSRLYDRIGIFQSSIGDLEPILGEIVQELTRDLLSHKLTPKQIEDRIDQTQRAIAEKRQLENQLVEQSAVFFGSSDYILEQIGQARKLGRWITPEDLKSFVNDFFDSNYTGTIIHWDHPETGLLTINLPNDARNDLADFCRRQTPVLMTGLIQPIRDGCLLTFRNEAAQTHNHREMLIHSHPLIQWIVACHERNPRAFFPTAAVMLNSDKLPQGTYLLAVEFWEFQGLRKEVQMAATISALGELPVKPELSPEEIIQEILNKGETRQFAQLAFKSDELMRAWERCVTRLGEKREKAFEIFTQKNIATYQRQYSNLTSYRDRKTQEWENRINTLRLRSGKTGQIRGFEAALQRHLEECRSRLDKLEQGSRTRCEFKEIVGILCEVKANQFHF